MSSQLSDKELEGFIRKNHTDIYRYLCHKGASSEDAEDLTQEAFMRIVQRTHVAGTGYLNRAYLFTIARNLLVDSYRAKGPESVELTQEIEEKLKAPEKERDGFAEQVSRLPEDLREVLTLEYAQGFKASEIAEITGQSRFAVRRKTKKALALLKEAMEGSVS